jgi:hypothetical protein
VRFVHLAAKAKTIAFISNEVFEVARTVMAVREYADKPIPDDVLRRILESAHLTASAPPALAFRAGEGPRPPAQAR